MTGFKDSFLTGVPVHQGYPCLAKNVIYETIGEGGVGRVYLAWSVKFGIRVAVKCLSESRPEIVDRFQREAQQGAQITHQNLVSVMDTGSCNNLHYIVMDYVDGENAMERVNRKGPLPEKEALLIIRDAARGLAEAHRDGTVHRDIKPENLMITRQGRVKVLDLGLAKVADFGTFGPTGGTVQGQVMGTPCFMPPEQWLGADKAAAASDVWALGYSLYTLLTGERPFPTDPFQARSAIVEGRGPDLGRLADRVSAEALEVLRKCVHPDPAERYPDAAALRQALNPVCSGDESDLQDPEAKPRFDASTAEPNSEVLYSIRQELEDSEAATPAKAAPTAEPDYVPTHVPTAVGPTSTTGVTSTMQQASLARKRPLPAAMVAAVLTVCAIVVGLIALRRDDPSPSPEPNRVANQTTEESDQEAPTDDQRETEGKAVEEKETKPREEDPAPLPVKPVETRGAPPKDTTTPTQGAATDAPPTDRPDKKPVAQENEAKPTARAVVDTKPPELSIRNRAEVFRRYLQTGRLEGVECYAKDDHDEERRVEVPPVLELSSRIVATDIAGNRVETTARSLLLERIELPPTKRNPILVLPFENVHGERKSTKARYRRFASDGRLQMDSVSIDLATEMAWIESFAQVREFLGAGHRDRVIEPRAVTPFLVLLAKAADDVQARLNAATRERLARLLGARYVISGEIDFRILPHDTAPQTNALLRVRVESVGARFVKRSEASLNGRTRAKKPHNWTRSVRQALRQTTTSPDPERRGLEGCGVLKPINQS